ncbi:MAG TPA: carbonic anhydrase family protein [Albitalea sp.]|nr:carbonic anhydrase family protein [Albitalea sp.]
MAKTPPAAADAPVLDDPVDAPAEGHAARARFALRWPAPLLRLRGRLARLPLPRLALSKKTMLIGAAAVLGVGAAGAAVYALWPAEPEWPRTPVVRHKTKRPKMAAAASSASAAMAAASQASAALAQAPVASGPENPMDRLQRRLGEVMGGGARLQPDGPGEWRLTGHAGAAASAVAARAHGEHGAASRSNGASEERVASRSAPVHGSGTQLPWSYEGPGGPDNWGRLRPEYAKCASGTRQSPIDLREGIQVQLEPVKFEYRPGRFGVIDTGHTVQVNVAPGNFIEVMGRRFELQQFHFHRPSEERIDGKQFDMEVHLVHKDAQGRLAVVAVLLERGSAQAVVQSVWNNLPLEKGEEQAAATDLDPQLLLPAERSYYAYMGSLTTPPCSEGVLWMVMKKPVPVSPEQVGIFARLYPMNARPVQASGGRLIKESSAQ